MLETIQNHLPIEIYRHWRKMIDLLRRFLPHPSPHLSKGRGQEFHFLRRNSSHVKLNVVNDNLAPPLLGALSCRFLIRGEPPNKNAAITVGGPEQCAHPRILGEVGWGKDLRTNSKILGLGVKSTMLTNPSLF